MNEEKLAQRPTGEFPKALTPPEAFIKWLEQQKEEEKYFLELANKSTADKPKHFIYIRSIVLDTHLILDYLISIVFGFTLTFGDGRHKSIISTDEAFEIVDYLQEKIDYAKRLKVISMLKIFSSKAIKILWDINTLRTAFAHSSDAKDKRYLYNGESIFNKATIVRFYSDKETVMSEFMRFLPHRTNDAKVADEKSSK